MGAERIRELEAEVADLRRENQALRKRIAAEVMPAALWNSGQDLFQDLLSRTQTVHYCIDLEQSRYQYISPAAERILGIPMEQLLALDISGIEALFHPDDLPASWERLHRACEEAVDGRAAALLEYRLRKATGEYVWIRDWCTAILNETGEIVRIEGEGWDISEERRMNAAMQMLTHYWQGILAHPRLLVIITDAEGTVLEWNDTAKRVTGWTGPELAKNPEVWETLYPDPEVRQRMRTLLADIVSGKQGSDEVTVELTKRDGGTCTLSVFFTVYRDEAGRPLRLINMAVDITGQRRTEEALLKRNAEISGILEHSPSCIHLLDAGGRFLLVNRTFEDLHGRSRKELAGRTPAEAFAPAAAEAITRQDQEVVAHGRTVHVEASMILGEELRTFQGVKFPLYDSEGVLLGLCAISEDVTEEKRLQAETLRAGHLASLGELAAGVAHEINNPITGMINYAQLLKDEQELGSENADICNRIIKEGQRVADIVRNLLSFAREGGQERGPFPLESALSSALDLTRSQLKKDGITVRIHLEPGLPLVWGRDKEIQQVILNLVSNSRYALNHRDAGARGDKELTISASAVRGPKRTMLRLEMADNGPGIPREILNRVCDPFFSTKPEGEGTGLGLSITYGIIRDHGGSLSFGGEPGKGAVVIVELPAAEFRAS